MVPVNKDTLLIVAAIFLQLVWFTCLKS